MEAALLENFSKAVESKGFEVEDVTVGVPEVDTDTQNRLMRLSELVKKMKSKIRCGNSKNASRQ